MAITEISVIHHVALVLFLLWLLHAFGYGRPIFYFLSLLYLYQVNERYVLRLNRKLRFEQRKHANQRRVLLESETVRWLNHAIDKIWPICMEEIVSQKIFVPIIPWFLDKYKPWTVKKASIQHLYLGRNPPIFTEMRVLREHSDDDHLVLELGLNFLTADDMSAILVAKLHNAVGFGIATKMHLTSMHVEGKVLVGVKFIRDWPYISRLRICFAEPPYFQMTVKPIFNHGVDVTEVPGIAGWLDNLLAVAFEQTLVEPNMLVVDMEKFVSPQSSPQKENWFSILVKDPVAYAKLEVIEGSDMKPSDPNGLADPYVKGQLGQYRFKTKIQRKTLSPKWQEEFKIPICSWESDNVLTIEVRDKDPFLDDNLGVCSVDINQLRDDQRHDMWVPLENVKMGRLHLAITVVAANSKEVSRPVKDNKSGTEEKAVPPENVMAQKDSGSSVSSKYSSKSSKKFADTFEAIDISGQKETGIWIHHPGSDVSQTWEPRKGRSRLRSDSEIHREVESVDSTPKESAKGSQPHSSTSDGHVGRNKTSHRPNILNMGFQMINNVFHKGQKKDDVSVSSREPAPSPHVNVRAVDANRIAVKLVADGHHDTKDADTDIGGDPDNKRSDPESIKGQANDMPESTFKEGVINHALSSNGSKNFSRISEKETKDRGIDDVNSESSVEDSPSASLHDTSLEGVPITSSQATTCSDNDTIERNEQIAAVDHDPPPAAVSCSELSSVEVNDTIARPCDDNNGEVMSKNA